MPKINIPDVLTLLKMYKVTLDDGSEEFVGIARAAGHFMDLGKVIETFHLIFFIPGSNLYMKSEFFYETLEEAEKGIRTRYRKRYGDNCRFEEIPQKPTLLAYWD